MSLMVWLVRSGSTSPRRSFCGAGLLPAFSDDPPQLASTSRAARTRANRLVDLPILDIRSDTVSPPAALPLLLEARSDAGLSVIDDLGDQGLRRREIPRIECVDDLPVPAVEDARHGSLPTPCSGQADRGLDVAVKPRDSPAARHRHDRLVEAEVGL